MNIILLDNYDSFTYNLLHYISELGAQVTVHALDLSKEEDVAKLAAAAGDCDILVNNAGSIPAGDITRLDNATIKSAWDLKVFGFLGLIREIYPKMCARGSGAIVNVIGMAGERPRAARRAPERSRRDG